MTTNVLSLRAREPRGPIRLVNALNDAVRNVRLCYECGDDVAELNSWDRLDSAWNALQVARGRVDPAFLRPQAG